MPDINTIHDVPLEEHDKVFRVTTDCGTFAMITWNCFAHQDAAAMSNALFGPIAKVQSVKRSNRRILIGCNRGRVNPNVFLLTYHPGRSEGVPELLSLLHSGQ